MNEAQRIEFHLQLFKVAVLCIYEPRYQWL